MSTHRYAAITLLATLALAGCGTAVSSGGATGQAPSSTSTTPSLPGNPNPSGAQPTAPSGSPPGHGQVPETPMPPPSMPPMRDRLGVSPDPRVIDLAPVRFDRVLGTGTNLTVEWASPGMISCHALGKVEVVETPEKVTITLLFGKLPGVDCSGPQVMDAIGLDTIVTLNSPLGTRPVVDGATG